MGDPKKPRRDPADIIGWRIRDADGDYWDCFGYTPGPWSFRCSKFAPRPMTEHERDRVAAHIRKDHIALFRTIPVYRKANSRVAELTKRADAAEAARDAARAEVVRLRARRGLPLARVVSGADGVWQVWIGDLCSEWSSREESAIHRRDLLNAQADGPDVPAETDARVAELTKELEAARAESAEAQLALERAIPTLSEAAKAFIREHDFAILGLRERMGPFRAAAIAKIEAFCRKAASATATTARAKSASSVDHDRSIAAMTRNEALASIQSDLLALGDGEVRAIDRRQGGHAIKIVHDGLQ